MSKIDDFFKQNWIKIIIFLILVIIAYLILADHNLRIYPCKTQPVVPNPPEFKETICPAPDPTIFGQWLGARMIYDPISYIIFYGGILIIPFILTYLIGLLFKKPNKRKNK